MCTPPAGTQLRLPGWVGGGQPRASSRGHRRTHLFRPGTSHRSLPAGSAPGRRAVPLVPCGSSCTKSSRYCGVSVTHEPGVGTAGTGFHQGQLRTRVQLWNFLFVFNFLTAFFFLDFGKSHVIIHVSYIHYVYVLSHKQQFHLHDSPRKKSLSVPLYR